MNSVNSMSAPDIAGLHAALAAAFFADENRAPPAINAAPRTSTAETLLQRLAAAGGLGADLQHLLTASAPLTTGDDVINLLAQLLRSLPSAASAPLPSSSALTTDDSLTALLAAATAHQQHDQRVQALPLPLALPLGLPRISAAADVLAAPAGAVPLLPQYAPQQGHDAATALLTHLLLQQQQEQQQQLATLPKMHLPPQPDAAAAGGLSQLATGLRLLGGAEGAAAGAGAYSSSWVSVLECWGWGWKWRREREGAHFPKPAAPNPLIPNTQPTEITQPDPRQDADSDHLQPRDTAKRAAPQPQKKRAAVPNHAEASAPAAKALRAAGAASVAGAGAGARAGTSASASPKAGAGADAGTAPPSPPASPAAAGGAPPKTTAVREKNRAAQRRFRDRQRDRLVGLESELEQLRQRVADQQREINALARANRELVAAAAGGGDGAAALAAMVAAAAAAHAGVDGAVDGGVNGGMERNVQTAGLLGLPVVAGGVERGGEGGGADGGGGGLPAGALDLLALRMPMDMGA